MTPPTARALAALLAFPVLAACDALGPMACTDEFVYGIEVTAVAAAGGEPLVGPVGIVRDGGYREEMVGAHNLLWGGGERPGTYDVEVAAPGFRTWRRGDVRVRGGDCHVERVRLRAELEAAG